MKTEINLQDTFLNIVRQQGQTVTVILTNGVQMRGVVHGFDSYVLILHSDHRQQMIYKHAISTIIPQQRVEFYSRREDKLSRSKETPIEQGETT